MKLKTRYNKLTLWNKIAFWGSVASIVALPLALWGTFVPQQYQPSSYKMFNVSSSQRSKMLDQSTRLENTVLLLQKRFNIQDPGDLCQLIPMFSDYMSSEAKNLSKSLNDLIIVSPSFSKLKDIIVSSDKSPFTSLWGLTQLLQRTAFTFTAQIIYPKEYFYQIKRYGQTKAMCSGKGLTFIKYTLLNHINLNHESMTPITTSFHINNPNIYEFIIPSKASRIDSYKSQEFDRFLWEVDHGLINPENIVVIISSMKNISYEENGGFFFYPNRPWQDVYVALDRRKLLGVTIFFELENQEESSTQWFSLLKYLPISNGHEIKITPNDTVPAWSPPKTKYAPLKSPNHPFQQYGQISFKPIFGSKSKATSKEEVQR